MTHSQQPEAGRLFAKKVRRSGSASRPVAFPVPASPGSVRSTAVGDVRIGPVAAAPLVLAELGVNPRRAFLRAGVPLRAFRNPENRIAFEDLGRLFSECAALTNCFHFGLLVGKRFDLKGLGAIGDLMRNCATVGDALRALSLQLHLHDRGAVPVLLDVEPSSVLLGYSIYRHGTPGAPQLYDGAVAIAYRVLSELCGPTWKPLVVQLSHGRPKDRAPYRQLFGANLRFDAEVSGVVFDAAWLDHAIVGADPALCDRITQAMRQARAGGTLSFADEVQGALHQMVLGGTSSAADVARLFGIHERTLRKRLAAEQTSLQQLVSQTRFELAQQLLANTRLPVSEIAAALRYADLAVFSRAFRNWAQVSPSEWRLSL